MGFRWQVSELESSMSLLPKKAQLAAAFVTYLSEASEDVRKETVIAWGNLLGIENFDLKK